MKNVFCTTAEMRQLVGEDKCSLWDGVIDDTDCIPLVAYFNSIGLKTTMCCQGHNNTNQCLFWIAFDSSVTEDDIRSFMHKHPQRLDKPNSFASCGHFCLRLMPYHGSNHYIYEAGCTESANGDLYYFLTGKWFRRVEI